MPAVQIVGGPLHGETMQLFNVAHGRHFRLPDPLGTLPPTPPASCYGAAEKPVRVKQSRYLAFVVHSQRPAEQWYAFHDGLGIDPDDDLLVVLEFFVNFYICHSDWADK